jgi:hypothetical protein
MKVDLNMQNSKYCKPVSNAHLKQVPSNPADIGTSTCDRVGFEPLSSSVRLAMAATVIPTGHPFVSPANKVSTHAADATPPLQSPCPRKLNATA